MHIFSFKICNKSHCALYRKAATLASADALGMSHSVILVHIHFSDSEEVSWIS
jgi:hypothetical protein